MKRWLLAMTVAFCFCSAQAGEDRRLKMLFYDYKLADDDMRPLSAGVATWNNKELPGHSGFYCSAAFFSWKDWRMEVGGTETWNEKKSRVEIGMLTGVSVRLWDRLVVGAWYAPFWNTSGRNPDDPWGFMVGYAFPTPGFGK